jgi:hypothetical protein
MILRPIAASVLRISGKMSSAGRRTERMNGTERRSVPRNPSTVDVDDHDRGIVVLVVQPVYAPGV